MLLAFTNLIIGRKQENNRPSSCHLGRKVGRSQVVAAVKQASAGLPVNASKGNNPCAAVERSGAAPLFWWPLGETSHQSVQFSSDSRASESLACPRMAGWRGKEGLLS